MEIIHSLKLVDYLHVQADKPMVKLLLDFNFQLKDGGVSSFKTRPKRLDQSGRFLESVLEENPLFLKKYLSN